MYSIKSLPADTLGNNPSVPTEDSGNKMVEVAFFTLN